MSFKPRVRLISHTFSGCNSRALYDSIPSYIAERYDVSLVEKEYYRALDQEISDSEIVVTTHCTHVPRHYQFNIELWHGFGPKTTRVMEPQLKSIDASLEYHLQYFQYINAIGSYSEFCSSILNGGFLAPGHAYKVTGMPRNDILFHSDGHATLADLFKEDFRDRKVVFYMPTWRDQYMDPNKSDGERSWNNLFGFESLDSVAFQKFLKENNMAFIVKLHPFEEKLYLERVQELLDAGIYLLTGSMLEEANVQTYHVLNACDLLITDYSSVYTDFLLLDRPVLFIPSDMEAYESGRGIWLTPYEFWAPGPKVFNQHALQEELIHCFADPHYYQEQREDVKSIVHRYPDDQSAERVWKLIDDLWNGVHVRKSSPVSKEEAAQRQTVKDHISALIQQGEIDTAGNALLDYEDEVPDDIDICTMKSIVLYMKQELDTAIQVLRAGYVSDPTNNDIVYNLAFMYGVKGMSDRSKYYYERALILSRGDEETSDILQRLSSLN